jgi:hypothetical protein
VRSNIAGAQSHGPGLAFYVTFGAFVLSITLFLQVWGVALAGSRFLSVGDDGAACVYSATSRA